MRRSGAFILKAVTTLVALLGLAFSGMSWHNSNRNTALSENGERRERAAEEQQRTEAERATQEELRRHASKVGFSVLDARTDRPTIELGQDTVVRIENRATVEIDGFQFHLSHRGPPGAAAAGSVMVSDSYKIPPCNAIIFSLSPTVDLAPVDMNLDRQRLTATDPLLIFFQTGWQWHLNGSGLLALQNDPQADKDRARYSIEIGQPTRLATVPLDQC